VLNNVIRLQPPLVLTADQAQKVIEVVQQSCAEVSSAVFGPGHR
jgi:acetylornithine/succinyldiaminopimelate/putrescine aminotransferase